MCLVLQLTAELIRTKAEKEPQRVPAPLLYWASQSTISDCADSDNEDVDFGDGDRDAEGDVDIDDAASVHS